MAKINLEQEFIDNRKRKKRAKVLGIISTSLITGFVIISYLGYAVGEHLANATTVSLIDQSDDIGVTEIGFRVPSMIPYADQEKYDLHPDEYQVHGDGYVYWTSTKVSGQAIRYIVNHCGYSANNTIEPVTSGPFQKGQQLNLLSQTELAGVSPYVEQTEDAQKAHYIAFELLFRVAHEQANDFYVGVEDYYIYLSRDIQFYGEDRMVDALRFGFASSLTTDIINPSRSQGGTTEVGGRLDLDRDGYFDYTLEGSRLNPDDPVGYQYEIGYGSFLEPLEADSWGEVLTADVPIEDQNALSFYHANSKNGVKPLLSYTPAVAEYSAFADYTVENPDGEAIAITDAKGIAEVSIKIWLEGWDASSIDELRDKTFGANLRFTASAGREI
ncbi:MAG: hypothetical protein WCR35_01550 [Bacilli bacterium]